MVQLSIQAVNNQNLFSNHYLENLIRKNDEWRSNEHKSVFYEIKKIYDDEKPFLEDLNESQLEKSFFSRIFKVMLPDFEVQAVTESHDFPDYAFFEDTNARDAARRDKGRRSFYQNAFAVGEVKRWNTNLDRPGKGKHVKGMNPSFQIWVYLHETEPEWGILSNGRLWRLYHQDKLMDSYYEVDLVTILENEDVDAFKYFYYFFRREAFFPSQKGAIFLENVLRGSEDYATDIGEKLKENVYCAMKILADGFFRHPANGLDRNDEKARLEVQSTTMRLLYRFLFLLYAEGKGLLSGRAYRESSYSFHSIKNAIKEEQDSRNAIHEKGTRYWAELQGIFGMINAGDETLGIPAYNGGLFDNERNPNLLVWQIGDIYLADAIDLLSRSDVGNGGRRLGFVDYSSLDVRHLGSIYEGLLEYRLRVAETDMVATGGKKKEWVSLEDFNSSRKRKKNFSDFNLFDRVKKDELYLSTDKGERKATGSYYTPDYIVNYIVKNTIDPVVDARWQKAKDRNESRIDATLSVKVLDPAMGSGHFLVGALEHLSARLMKAVTIDEEFGRIPDDERGQYTLEWAKREVASHCIYGVDLNYLAVELAKVSLWLKTIAMDKPLSFLDHRLKCGNSLIGARLVDLKEYPSSERRGKKTNTGEQSTLPSFVSRLFIDHLIGKIGELETISDDSLSDIKRKERVFEEFRQLPEYRKAKAMADVYTAVYFGNEVGARVNKKSEDVYHDIVWAIKGDEAEWQRKTNRAWFREAQRIAEDKSFFHWELEFPDVFFEDGGAKDNPGWECVIGNPPYVNANELNKTLSEFEKSFWKEQFKSASGAYDLYILFLEQSINLTQYGHYSSLITPNKFLSAPYAKALREHIHNKAQLIRLLNLSRVRVFEDPSIYPVISIIRNIIPADTYPIVTEIPRDPPGPINIVTYKHNSSSLTALPDMIWGFLISDQLSLILNAEKISTQLQRCSTVRASSTASEADAYEDALSKTSIDGGTKFINTGLIDRYATLWGVVPLTHKGVTFATPYLRMTHSVVPSKRKTQYEKQKIVFAKMALRIEAFLDENGEYASANTNFVYDSDYNLCYLTALLNSRFMTVLYSIYFGTLIMSGGYFQFQAPQLRVLPIRRINFTTPSPERTVLVESLKSRYAANKFDKIIQLVEECLPTDAEGNFVTDEEKSDVVHDLLAFLAERMIEMNKEKNVEIKGFLEWFEREIGAKIETLTNRTKLKQYHDLGFDELLDILKKNKKKIPVNISNRELQGNLKDEFEGSMRKLRPLIERIEKTDELIDQVVYRLYGLSEEEIKVVEGDN